MGFLVFSGQLSVSKCIRLEQVEAVVVVVDKERWQSSGKLHASRECVSAADE